MKEIEDDDKLSRTSLSPFNLYQALTYLALMYGFNAITSKSDFDRLLFSHAHLERILVDLPKAKEIMAWTFMDNTHM